MKDRIKQLMEAQHMNQQSFASLIGIAPATLNSILLERTRPTLNTVEAISRKLPKVNVVWLLNGSGEMYVNESAGTDKSATGSDDAASDAAPGYPAESGMLPFNFDDDDRKPNTIPASGGHSIHRQSQQRTSMQFVEAKNIDKQQRRITEIRVFYDDQTWESFVPKK